MPKTAIRPKPKKSSQSKTNQQKSKNLRRYVVLLIIVAVAVALTFWQKSSYSKPWLVADEPLNIPKISEKTKPLTRTQKPVTKVVDSQATQPVHDYTIPPVQNGLAPILVTIPTTQPVVFLGIDDGFNKQPFELRMMKDNNVKATLFLTQKFISDNPGFFTDFVRQGSQIEDHTVDHALLSNLTYAEQKQEICDEADWLQQEYGRRPVLFRPPGGDYNVDTQRAAADCGMKALVLWVAKANGGSMQYQVGHSLRPGDIVLMHFRPEFKADLQAFLGAEKAAGLHTELLEDLL